MALESARHHHRIVRHASGQQTGHPEHTAVALRLRISPILDRPTRDPTIARKLYLLTGGGQLYNTVPVPAGQALSAKASCSAVPSPQRVSAHDAKDRL